MPRGIDRYDEAVRQGRLWTPALFRNVGKLSIWVGGADDPITGSSGVVSQWDDLSGNANHLTESGANTKPVYNPIGWKSPGRNGAAVEFDAAANPNHDRLNLTSSIAYNGTNGCSTRAAVRQNATAASRTIHSGAQGSFQLRLSSTHKIEVVRTNLAIIQSATVVLSTGWHIVGGDAATNLSRCWSNGQSEQQTATNPAFTQPITLMGISGAASNESFNAGIAEWLYSNLIWTTAESNKVDGYLAWRWGTVDQLYALHPFKNRPPLIGD